MKKLFFFVAGFAAFTAHAQLNQFGFTAGTTISNYKSKSGGNDESGNSKAGFTAGVLANLVVNKNFIIQPSLNWLQKGSKDEQTFAGITATAVVTINYIELPVNFLYRNNGFFIGGGPSIAIGISGKWKISDGTNKTTEKVKFGGSDNDDLKAFDFGMNALGGYQFKSGFFIAANYNLGISNLAPGTTNNDILKSRYAGIKLGYLLGGAKEK